MSARSLLLWSLALGLYCVQDVSTYSLGGACNSSDCIIKCCPKNQIYVREDDEEDDQVRCVDSSEFIKFYVKNPNIYSDIDFYNKDIQSKIHKTNKKISSFKFEYVTNFTHSAQALGCVESYTAYLLEDGKFMLRRLNYLNQWIPFEPGQFCLEHLVILKDVKPELESEAPDVVVWVLTDPSDKPPSNARALLSAYGLLVSCVFLLLVLAVYALLPELRNLAGLILMSYMSTYFAFFLTRVIHVFGNDSEVLTTNTCVAITIMFHYLMLSTFCWMNVMSFDIWWTFRRIRKASQSHRRSVMSKFWRYCVYAWGLPLVPTLFVVIVDQLDLTHLPNFVKPHIFDSCYFEPELHLLYVSIPILILICVNVVLFLLTAYNIWQVNRGVTLSKDSANTKKNESHRKIKRTSDTSGGVLHLSFFAPAELVERAHDAELSIIYLFWMYLRLSLVMGVSWILEVISNLVEPESPVWGISDLYNALVGLFIFLLFVCKKNIFLRLCTRLSIDNKLVRWVRAQEADSRVDTNAKSSASQQTDASEVEPWNPTKEVTNKPDDI